MDQAARRFNSCCFTGHRPALLPAGGVEGAIEMRALDAALRRAVEAAVSIGVTNFYAGGAEGFDTLAAEIVLSYKKQHPVLRLCLALPGNTPPVRWSARQKQRYEAIRAAADEIFIASADEAYPNARYHIRNRYMVDRSDLVIAYLTASAGGTFSTVSYAKKMGRTVWNLADSIASFPVR